MSQVLLVLLGAALALAGSIVSTTAVELRRWRADAMSAARVIYEELLGHGHIVELIAGGDVTGIPTRSLQLETSAWRDNRFALLRWAGPAIREAIGDWYGRVEGPASVYDHAEHRRSEPPDGELFLATQAAHSLATLGRWDLTAASGDRLYAGCLVAVRMMRAGRTG